MTDTDTITLTRAQYEALLTEKETLEDQVAAFDADDGSRIPHEVALAIMQGKHPIVAFRTHLGVTVRDLAARTGIATSADYASSNAGANPALRPFWHALPGPLGRRLTPW